MAAQRPFLRALAPKLSGRENMEQTLDVTILNPEGLVGQISYEELLAEMRI